MIGAQDAGPVGPMYNFHHRSPTDTFDLDVGFPVRKPIATAERVQPGPIPSATAARAIYRGGYEGLGGGWGEFMGWIRANGPRCRGNVVGALSRRSGGR